MRDLITKLQEIQVILENDPFLKNDLLGLSYSFNTDNITVHTRTHPNSIAEVKPHSLQYDQQETEVAPGIVVLTLLPREKVSA